MRTATVAATAIAASLLLSACAGYDQAAGPTPVPGHEGVPRPTPAAPGARTASEAVRRVAELDGTWTRVTYARHQLMIARYTTGAARDTARLAAATPLAALPEGQSTDAVRLVVLRPGATRSAYLVLSHARTNLAPPRWRITRATAQRVAGGWVVREWTPEP